jgi:S1-C subfamily serine protease
MYRKSLVLLSVLGAFLVLGVTPVAHAGFWDTLWNTVRPLIGSHATTSPQSPVVPLYQPALDYEKAVVDAVQKASPAVVSITISKNVPIIEQCPGSPLNLPPEFQQFFGEDFGFSVPCEKGTKLQEIGGGSGFIISSDGLVLTNKHVASDPDASYTVFTSDGKKYPAKVLDRDPLQDLAVLRIEATNLPTVELGDSDSLALGQTAIAIGNALGEFRNTVSVGVISGLARTVTAQGGGTTERIQGVIQTDAAINPGNSGGPLLNLRGQVVGVNTAVVSGAQNIGFAIPVNRAKRAIQSVKANGSIVLPYLGVRYLTVTADIAKKEKLPKEYGALVRGSTDGPAVTPDSPAARAGIQAEDLIVSLNGKSLEGESALIDLIAEHEVGDTVTLTLYRGGTAMDVKVVLGKRPE